MAALSCQLDYNNKDAESTFEKNIFTDSATGFEVWQITNHDSISEAPYFYAPAFTSDDKYIIFRSRRGGKWDIYRSELETGEIVRLTYDGVEAACIHPDGKSMVYIANWKYYKMDVESLEKQVLVDFTDRLPSEPVFRPSITSDGRFTIVMTRSDERYKLFKVNLESKEIQNILNYDLDRISHAQINPNDANLVTYVPYPDLQNDMSLPLELRVRTRIIRINESIDEPFVMPPYGFRATHDSWSPKGDRYFFFEKTRPDWTPAAIASIDKNGNDYIQHYISDSIYLGHGSASYDGKWFISDSQESFSNPLVMINLEDGIAKIIGWPNASINTDANVHVHPNFSSSGNYVIYTSDVKQTDIHQVFVVPVREIKNRWKELN
jgi:Tol biopolymer transport system component